MNIHQLQRQIQQEGTIIRMNSRPYTTSKRLSYIKQIQKLRYKSPTNVEKNKKESKKHRIITYGNLIKQASCHINVCNVYLLQLSIVRFSTIHTYKKILNKKAHLLDNYLIFFN